MRVRANRRRCDAWVFFQIAAQLIVSSNGAQLVAQLSVANWRADSRYWSGNSATPNEGPILGHDCSPSQKGQL